MLQLFALTVMVFPSDAVIRAIGASAYLAGLISMFVFAVFLTASLFGLHNPLEHRHPIRGLLCLLWLSALASYVLMDQAYGRRRNGGADRMLIQLAVITGVALVAAECLGSLHDIRRVLRSFAGAARSVAWSRRFNSGSAWTSRRTCASCRGFAQLRQSRDRRPGGVEPGRRHGHSPDRAGGRGRDAAATRDLPGDLRHRPQRTSRWLPVVLIGVAISTSVSRSAIIAAGMALAVLVVLMPARQRLVALGAVPIAVLGAFMSAPGLIGAGDFFGAGTSDPSVAARVSDYPSSSGSFTRRLVRPGRRHLHRRTPSMLDSST